MQKMKLAELFAVEQYYTIRSVYNLVLTLFNKYLYMI